MNISATQFLHKRDETGRYMVYSQLTGITYCVEPIDTNQKTDWGDVNPATGKVEGGYGLKYKGSVKISESLITEENGFKNIETLKAGVSPMGYITEVDEQRYKEGFRPKNSEP
jgi:hypothetical protein